MRGRNWYSLLFSSAVVHGIVSIMAGFALLGSRRYVPSEEKSRIKFEQSRVTFLFWFLINCITFTLKLICVFLLKTYRSSSRGRLKI
ncbi:hypothetical protein ACOME3_006768 [Neoechinorhynchus agilis]